MHELSVPKEAKQENETEGCNECEEEFFPVHNVFLFKFLVSPTSPKCFIAKPGRYRAAMIYKRCRSKFL
ncbi:MAG: hypothetical protein DMF00_11080 [Verrucomicrobia bacterium]|nr:MAG: hypothetical protein DMF00_11080 [Verrucomicrobiota bacterium]